MAQRTPDSQGYFGRFGGMFVPETLVAALQDLDAEYRRARKDPRFRRQLRYYLSEYAGRPTPLYRADNLARELGIRRVYLKREDLLHTGAHKINNCLGQILLARRMGKSRVIAETGAGQHGVATATVAALFGMQCVVFMGTEDIERQKLNVFRMKLLGARVVPVASGSCTLKDSINEAMRDWVTNVSTTFYVFGTVAGPHPYPVIVRDFQSVIGREARLQLLRAEKRLPDYLVACVGGGSNAIGLFSPFYADERVRFIGVEAGGRGLASGSHAATICRGREGVLHGAKSLVLEDEGGQIKPTHSVSAGLDYPGVGPEHAHYHHIRRAQYVSVTDIQALDAVEMLARCEGIIPALESAHALAYLKKMPARRRKNALIVVCVSGRGDKDMPAIMSHLHYEQD